MRRSTEITLLCDSATITPYSGTNFEVCISNPKPISKTNDDIGAFLSGIDIDAVINYYSPEEILKQTDTEDIIDSIDFGDFMFHHDIDDCITYYGVENILDEISTTTIEGYLESVKKMKGIKTTTKSDITDGRLLFDDKTFYTRLLSHLQQCQANCLPGFEELEYLIRYAEKLQKFQIDTVEKDSEEYMYLKNLSLV